MTISLNFFENLRRKVTLKRYVIFTVICFFGFFLFFLMSSFKDDQSWKNFMFSGAALFVLAFFGSAWLGLVYTCLYYLPFKSNFYILQRVTTFFAGLLIALLPIGLLYVLYCTGDKYSPFCYILEPLVFPYRILEFISR